MIELLAVFVFWLSIVLAVVWLLDRLGDND